MNVTPVPTAGEIIRQRRLALGLTQERLALRAGLSTSTVRLIEYGMRVSPNAGGRLERAFTEAEAESDGTCAARDGQS